MNNEMFSNEGTLYHGMSDPALYSAINKIVHSKSADDMSRPSKLPDDMVVAMAYVPLQFYSREYEPDEGFDKGTMFPELNKPFMPGDMR